MLRQSYMARACNLIARLRRRQLESALRNEIATSCRYAARARRVRHAMAAQPGRATA